MKKKMFSSDFNKPENQVLENHYFELFVSLHFKIVKVKSLTLLNLCCAFCLLIFGRRTKIDLLNSIMWFTQFFLKQ